MSSEKVRPASHQGSWYTDDKPYLSQEISAYIEKGSEHVTDDFKKKVQNNGSK